MPAVVDVESLVLDAAEGNSEAWAELVDRYGGLIYSIARSSRLNAADATDVCQTTWLRLVEHLERLNEPAAVGAWLATTARRESLRILRMGSRQSLTAEEIGVDPRRGPEPEVDAALLDAERDAVLHEALGRLPTRCAELLGMLMADDAPGYRELSEALQIPIGSIGPTRARCLQKLRAILAEIDADFVPSPNAPSS